MANRYGRDIGRRPFGRSSAYGGTPFADDERYFGGSRRYGQGYTGRSDLDTTYERDYGRVTDSDRSEDYGEKYETGRSRPGSEQGYRGEFRRTYPDRGYGNYGSTRFEERFGGQGAEDFARYAPNYPTYGPGYGAYGPSYPMSERGYLRDYDEGEERGWWDKTSDEVASWFGDEEAARRRRMDAWNGGHRGRGPSGYVRSDERIKEDISDRLTDYDYIDATNISVEVSGGEVTLSGTVDSRYEKRLAEDLAEDVSGVRNVENRVRVSDTWRDTSTPSTTTAMRETGGRSKGASGT
jgi:hypothetical protein